MAAAHVNRGQTQGHYCNRTAVVSLHGYNEKAGNQQTRPVPRNNNFFNVTSSDRLSLGNLTIFLFIVATAAVPLSMLILGMIHYNSCTSDSKLGLYMVVQGSFWLVIPVVIGTWHCGQQCVDIKHLMWIILPLSVFIIVWSAVGCVWIFSSNCSGTWVYTEAIGFTAALWGLLLLLFIGCCCHND